MSQFYLENIYLLHVMSPDSNILCLWLQKNNVGGIFLFSDLPIVLGGERNRKQRIPVNSITSKLVLKSIYASGSTGPFFDNHFMNKHDSSFAKKTDFLSRYLVLSEIRYARKRNWSKQERNLLSKVFNLFEIFEITEQEDLLHSLLSAWTFVYWNMNTRWKYFLNYSS